MTEELIETTGSISSQVVDLNSKSDSDRKIPSIIADQPRTDIYSLLRGGSALAILLTATTLADSSLFLPSNETGAAVGVWQLEGHIESESSVAYRSATEEDLDLDSPNWMASRLTQLESRGFSRVNDPRRHTR